MIDISIPEESEIRPMRINQFKTKVSLAEKNPNIFTTSEREKIGINDYLNKKLTSPSENLVYFHKTCEPTKNQKLYNDEESEYDFKDLDELKIGENINKFENHNTINRETVASNFSLHRPIQNKNSEEYLLQARKELNEINKRNERALNNILNKKNYPSNTNFIHCRNCMLILAIRSKYYINK